LTETIINLDTLNPIEFFGVNNKKLDILRKKFPLLKILSRGTQIKLSGAPEQVESAKEKIDLIIQYMERNGDMSENHFERILGGDDAETIDNFVSKNPNDILVFGPNGKTVRARTLNQKKMVQAADANDIVFAVGPAGTGKTYTAVALAVRALKNKLVKKIILTRPAVEAGESTNTASCIGAARARLSSKEHLVFEAEHSVQALRRDKAGASLRHRLVFLESDDSGRHN